MGQAVSDRNEAKLEQRDPLEWAGGGCLYHPENLRQTLLSVSAAESPVKQRFASITRLCFRRIVFEDCLTDLAQHIAWCTYG